MLKLNQRLARLSATTGAAFVMGTLVSSDAHASGKTFNDIAANITKGIQNLPGLVGAVCYIMGLIFAVLGILKIKDHVENPSQTPLKDGAIRLAVGGGLFALPIITASMQTLINDNNADAINGNQLYNIKMLNKAS
jgi:intracellular multiplication protein IcmD